MEGFRILVEKFDYINLIASYSDPFDFLSLVKEDAPDVVFMDVELPGIKGYDLTKQVLKIHPQLKVIALSMSTDGYTAKKMLDAGVVGYMTKGMSSKTIDDVFNAIADNRIYIAPEIALNQVFQTGEMDLNFSEQDLKIIQLLSQGASSKEIGENLKLAERSVELEKTKLFKKTGVSTAIELITMAFKLKILT